MIFKKEKFIDKALNYATQLKFSEDEKRGLHKINEIIE